MVTRISQQANHNLRIKGRVRARGSRGQNWYSETRSQFVKKKARTQSLWMLHLAGDFHHTLERETPRPKPILMRVMLVSNLDVKQRFANGTSYFWGVCLHSHVASRYSRSIIIMVPGQIATQESNLRFLPGVDGQVYERGCFRKETGQHFIACFGSR